MDYALKQKIKVIEACKQCQNRKEAPLHNAYNPLCLLCGAHGIRGLQRMAIERTLKTARLKAWLAGYVEDGHDEKDLRRLALNP